MVTNSNFHMLFCVCVCVCVCVSIFSPFYEDTNHIGLEPTLF